MTNTSDKGESSKVNSRVQEFTSLTLSLCHEHTPYHHYFGGRRGATAGMELLRARNWSKEVQVLVGTEDARGQAVHELLQGKTAVIW